MPTVMSEGGSVIFFFHYDVSLSHSVPRARRHCFLYALRCRQGEIQWRGKSSGGCTTIQFSLVFFYIFYYFDSLIWLGSDKMILHDGLGIQGSPRDRLTTSKHGNCYCDKKQGHEMKRHQVADVFVHSRFPMSHLARPARKGKDSKS